MVAVLFAILFVGVIACNTKSPVQNKKIGLQLWSVREDMEKDLEGNLKKIGEMGYSFVEAANYNNGLFYGKTPEEFKNLLSENGLVMLSSHTGPDLPDSTSWDSTMAWWDKAIADHKAVGASYIVKPSMGGDAYKSLETLKKYCEYFNAVGEKCNKEGLEFGYHNHDAEFKSIDSTVLYDFMLQNTDPKKVFFEMDLFWVIKGNAEPVAYFEKYPGRFLLWHVKDETEVGASGNIDFEAIFKQADKAGMKEIIVEVENYNFPPMESVKKSLEFLQQAEFVK